MSPTPAAQATHDGLLPGRVSTLSVTDPELVAAIDAISSGSEPTGESR